MANAFKLYTSRRVLKPICQIKGCSNPSKVKESCKTRNGAFIRHRFYRLCYTCLGIIPREKQLLPELFKNTKCVNCGLDAKTLGPEGMCAMATDHIDGNSNNNNTKNLQQLCSNCHQIKTQTEKDWLKNLRGNYQITSKRQRGYRAKKT